MITTIILLVIITLVVWFLQNLIHEGSHLIVGKIVEGRKPLKLIPFPHIYNGRLYFARYENGPPTKAGSPIYRHAAPLIAGLYMIFVGVCLTVFFWEIYFVPLVVCPAVDCFVWLWGYIRNSKGTDGYFYRLCRDKKI
jgi:hypothetical protein